MKAISSFKATLFFLSLTLSQPILATDLAISTSVKPDFIEFQAVIPNVSSTAKYFFLYQHFPSNQLDGVVQVDGIITPVRERTFVQIAPNDNTDQNELSHTLLASLRAMMASGLNCHIVIQGPGTIVEATNNTVPISSITFSSLRVVRYGPCKSPAN